MTHYFHNMMSASGGFVPRPTSGFVLGSIPTGEIPSPKPPNLPSAEKYPMGARYTRIMGKGLALGGHPFEILDTDSNAEMDSGRRLSVISRKCLVCFCLEMAYLPLRLYGAS